MAFTLIEAPLQTPRIPQEDVLKIHDAEIDIAQGMRTIRRRNPHGLPVGSDLANLRHLIFMSKQQKPKPKEVTPLGQLPTLRRGQKVTAKDFPYYLADPNMPLALLKPYVLHNQYLLQ